MTSFVAVRQHITSLKYARTKRNSMYVLLYSNSCSHEALEVPALYFYSYIYTRYTKYCSKCGDHCKTAVTVFSTRTCVAAIATKKKSTETANTTVKNHVVAADTSNEVPILPKERRCYQLPHSIKHPSQIQTDKRRSNETSPQ